MIIKILRISESRNQLDKLHWGVRNKKAKVWRLEVMVIKNNNRWPDCTTKQKVIITSYRKRKLDKDNLSGGLKSCVDALKKNKLIVDDSPEWVEVVYRQEIDSKNLRTEIEIRDFAFPGHGGLQVPANRRGL